MAYKYRLTSEEQEAQQQSTELLRHAPKLMRLLQQPKITPVEQVRRESRAAYTKAMDLLESSHRVAKLLEEKSAGMEILRTDLRQIGQALHKVPGFESSAKIIDLIKPMLDKQGTRDSAELRKLSGLLSCLELSLRAVSKQEAQRAVQLAGAIKASKTCDLFAYDEVDARNAANSLNTKTGPYLIVAREYFNAAAFFYSQGKKFEGDTAIFVASGCRTLARMTVKQRGNAAASIRFLNETAKELRQCLEAEKQLTLAQLRKIEDKEVPAFLQKKAAAQLEHTARDRKSVV